MQQINKPAKIELATDLFCQVSSQAMGRSSKGISKLVDKLLEQVMNGQAILRTISLDMSHETPPSCEASMKALSDMVSDLLAVPEYLAPTLA